MTTTPPSAAADSSVHDSSPIAHVPPDPVAYDSERSVAARKRGLATPYIPGGRDPDQATAEREERRYVRILLAMVITIVFSGFVLGIIAALLGLDALAGRPG
ncbi:MAG TPA: hypothetical protein VM427_01220 [Patescibacteria group bacterium]|nr:hypothetical protein [Patescibacteria group bacterium]